MRASGKEIRVVGVEPVGSTYFSTKGCEYMQSGTGNPPGASIPKNFDRNQINDSMQIGDAAAFTACKFLATHHGILIGGSAGGVMLAAITYTTKHPNRTISVILADAGEKYLSTIFREEWLEERGLFDENTWGYLTALHGGHAQADKEQVAAYSSTLVR